MKTSLLDRITRTLGTAFVAALLTASVAATAFATTYFSNGSVAPNTLTNWKTNRDGTGTSPANFAAADTFVIESPDNMTTSAAWAVSGTGAKIQIESGGTLTANNLVSVPNFQIDNGGTYVHNATGSSANGAATDFPGSATRSFGPSSTVEFRAWANGGTSPVALPAGITWGNLTFNVTLLNGSWNQTGNLTTIAGNLTVSSTGGTTRELRLTGAASPTINLTGDLLVSGGVLNLTNGAGAVTLNIGGNLSQTGGTLTSTGGGINAINFTGGIASPSITLASGTFTSSTVNWSVASGKTLSVSGSFAPLVATGRTMTVNGAFRIDPTTTLGTTGSWSYGSNASLIFNESAGRTVDGTSQFWPTTNAPTNVTISGSGTVTLNQARTVTGNLTMTNGAMTLGADLTVQGTLALNAQKITTSTNKVILPASGSLTRTSGYVIGNLQKNVATGSSVARTFEVGDATRYAPASVTFASVSGAGDLTGSTAVPGSFPSGSLPGGPDLHPSKYVNRSWTLTNSGVAFTSYDATLTFDPADIQGSGNTTNFIVAKNSSGTYTHPAVGTRTSASTQTTGLTAFSDFYVGEPGSFTITASAGSNGSITPSGAVSVAAGASQSFTITPNGGYIVQDVLVDAVSVGAVTSYNFPSVTANHTISATFMPDPVSTVNATSPGSHVTTVATSQNVPVTLSRGVTTPILGFSVTFQLSSGMTTVPASIVEGGFLTASGGTTNFQVVDNGGGSYTVDGVTLGIPCGSSATSGTLFTVPVGSTNLTGPGTLTITNVTLRDCSNATLASAIGTAATVQVDRSTPAVTVTAPNGGESWQVGSVHAITWTATDAEGIAANSITLEYSTNNGSSWLPVASGLANSGTYNWTIPNTPSTQALVRASTVDIHSNPANDASNAVFTVQGTSSTSLASAPDPSVVGQSVTLTATVTPSAATGTVEFFDGATSLGTAPVSSGSAAINTSSLAVGPHANMTAVYSGDALYAGSTSAAHSHTVNQASTAASLTSAPNPSVVGESVALTATVSVTAPGSATPTGTVQFFDGATSLGSAPVSAGSAVLNTSSLAVGPHTSLTAVYSGDTNLSGSTSAAHSHTVNQASTTTSLASAPNPSLVGESVALTATVSVTAPGGGSPGGTVEFFDGATSLGTSPVSSGAAVLNTSSLSVGTHASLTAVYAGSAGYSGSTSAAHSHTVNQASTTTALNSAPNPSVVGESVALTATVSVTAPGAGSPSGTVEFFDGATSLGTAPVSSGSAVLNTSSLAVGSHASLTAVYSGDASYTGSTSAAHSHTVNQASTTTSVASVPNPSAFGQNVAITATVSVNAPGAGTATGSVEFFDGATSLGTSPVASGSAVLNTSALAVGPHTLTATYSGDANFSGSTSATQSHTVSAAGSSTSLASSPNPSVVGESVALTATVTPASATGTVQFFDGATSLGTSAVSSGTAVLSTSSLALGAHSLTAVYSGDGSYSGSTSAAHSHTVNQANTSTSLASAPNPSAFGQSVALTATVSVTAPGSGSPGGTVQFFDGATLLGSSPVASGSAVLNTSSLAVGAHPSLTAVYSGDADFTGSTSAAHSHTVNQASTTTSLASAANPSVVGESVALTATVSVDPPGSGSPSGTVQFFDGATLLGSSSVSSGSAVLNTSSLALGTHANLTAVYSGDASFTGSTSAAHSHTVNQASTTTSLTSAPNPTLFGQQTTLTATVAVSAPGAGSATGTVEFFEGATSLGISPVVAGSAALNISTLAVGPHSLTATYSGDANFTTSTSAVHIHNVNTAATTTTVATSPNPSVVGEGVAITASVSPPAATGTVEFFDGATSLGTAPVSSGSAAINTSSLTLGSHSITAAYSGDATYDPSTSAAHTHTVNQASSITSLASAANPSVVGESVALTATVSVNPPGSTSTSGTVEFFDGATSLGTAPVSSGTAVLNTSSLALGSHSLTAMYSGNTNLAGSTSAIHNHTVNQASTSTSVATVPNPSTFGQNVAITATVSVTAPGAGSPSGNVEFFDGATSLGTSPVSAGTAVLNTAALAVGPHSLTAVYAGDTNFSGSTSAAHSHTVNAASSSTALTSSPNPSVVGESVALTATVTPVSATGTVEFFDGATSLGTSPVSSGTAVLNTSALALGGHSLTAVYSGDGSYGGSTSSAHSHTVNQASTSTAVATVPNPSVVGGNVAITATVSVNPPGAGSPSGTVEFFDGATSLGTSPVSSGAAVLNTSSLALGAHSLTAVYSGDTNFSGSTSAIHNHTVNQASSSTALASAANPSVVGESVALTATVSVNPPGSTSTSGTVEFFDGATSLGTAPVSSGTAVLNTSSLALGSHSLTAVYSGNTNLAGSTSAVHNHTVDQASTSTALDSAPNPSTFGGSVALTATVSVNAPGAGSPSGSVEFFDGATSLGTSPVSSGTAVLNTLSLAVGLHSLTAVYSGDVDLTGSTSAAHSHTVNAAGSNTALTSTPNPSNFGQNVQFTASITPASATGTVEFFDGASSLGTAPVSSGTAVLNTSALAVGSHSITAVYSGDGSYAGSTSNLVTQVVSAAGSSVSLVAAPDPGIYQDNETLTATVTPSVATGTVEFFDGATSLGTSPVSSGTAQLVTSTLAVGVHSLTAVYSGDGSYSGATSSAYSLEVKAKIVATAGPNGSLAPLGTTLYSLNATPSYTFTADPGYHVASVTVDGGAAPLTSPYAFGPVSSNHTIDVQFAVNPAVPAIANLAASQVRTGNDADGTTQITLTWSGVAGGSTVEVYRKGFGNYPEYDDGPSPGSVPTSPASYPPAGWTLTTVSASGTTDEPGTRDFWYYVAYVKDVYGTVSPVSNMTTGALNYHLGDISDGAVLGGDNKVTSADISALGMHYGIFGPAVDAFNYLDVGPTTNLSTTARPTTDNKVNFEDLVMFALNYFPVTSAPNSKAQPAAASQDALAITAPTHVTGVGSDVPLVLSFTGTGRVVGISAQMTWDPAVVEPVSYTAGDAMLEQNGLVFSATPGSVDGATFAGNGEGIVGEGEFATIHFRVLAAGDPQFGFADVLARDLQNRPVHMATGVTGVTPRTYTTAFAPPMPNPFGRSTMFQISLAKAGPAELHIFSVDGRRVRTLSSGPREAGEYRIEWNGTDDSGRPLAAGVYYARFVTSGGRFTRVVTLLR